MRALSHRGCPTAALNIASCLATKQEYADMNILETLAILLVIFWILGLVTSYTMGGFIHILLVIAIVMILIRVIQGRRL